MPSASQVARDARKAAIAAREKAREANSVGIYPRADHRVSLETRIMYILERHEQAAMIFVGNGKRTALSRSYAEICKHCRQYAPKAVLQAIIALQKAGKLKNEPKQMNGKLVQAWRLV